MTGSIERVRKLFAGELPDRPPIHDVIMNDSVLEYFGGDKITRENAERVVFDALPKILDSARPYKYFPLEESRIIIEDEGIKRKRYIKRWTIWTEPIQKTDTAQWIKNSRNLFKKDIDWLEEDVISLNQTIESRRNISQKLGGNVFFFWALGKVGLEPLFTTLGLEQFSYLMVDDPAIIAEYLEFRTTKLIQLVEHLPDGLVEGVFLGDDIAFKTGTIFSVTFLRKYFFPRLARIIKKMHEKKIKVMFHSDGNLMGVMDDLIDCGIDLLNPFETAAGMDVEKVHKSHPHLIIAGGIDTSQTLFNGSPQEIRETVRKTIELAEGKIMVGSTTEIHNAVPLKNFLAMHEAVMEYRF